MIVEAHSLKRILALVLMAAAAVAMAQESPMDQPPVWDDATLEAFSAIPIQDEGRVKPLSTFARFKLIAINGSAGYRRGDDGDLLPAISWLLDMLFYPQSAEQYRTFRVEDAAVLDAVGLHIEGRKKRDRYAYVELKPYIDKIFELSTAFNAKEPAERTAFENQMLSLATHIHEYEAILHAFDFARHEFLIASSQAMQALFGGTDVTYSGILGKSTTLLAALQELRREDLNVNEERRQAALNDLLVLFGDLERVATLSSQFPIFPPPEGSEEIAPWASPGELLVLAVTSDLDIEQHLAATAQIEQLVAARDNPIAFESQVQQLQGALVSLAKDAGAYEKIPLEILYYRLKFFFYALWLFFLAFVLVAITWLRPRSAFLYVLSWIAMAAPTLILIAGITMRCILRERPPVSTLYETILFITACAVVAALFMELVNRQRIAIGLAALLGMFGMFLANSYEIKEGSDTMPKLIAVLDTNFWLSTHVTTVAIGYSAGLLAAATAHVYLLGRFFKFKQHDRAFYRSVTRMTYGILCFGLLFSVLGTVLGGIWANDSWGRFWGWDPKENGALMICLWSLAVLHARMGGYIKHLGINMCAIVLGMIVAFSWWGVNLLGIGLHSYGFTSGIFTSLAIFYVMQLVVLCAGLTVWLRQRTEPGELSSAKSHSTKIAPTAK